MPYPVGFILPNCEISDLSKGYGEKVQAFVEFTLAKGDNVLYSGSIKREKCI